MATRTNIWKMSGGETLSLAKSLRGDMEDGDTLTGETPTVEVHQKSGSSYVNVTATKNFTVASAAVNTSELTDGDGDAIAVGDGVQFRLTAGDVGSYKVRIECDTSNGDHAVSEVDLIVGDTT